MPARVQLPPQQLFIGGRWTDAGAPLEVRDKYSGDVIATVPTARREDVEAALAAAQRGAAAMAALPAHRRSAILARAVQLLDAKRETLARLIAAEAGKALKFARAEVGRGIATFALAAEEARRIHGETVPMDAVPAGEGYAGFWVRRPVGVVVAITPFNFPLNLVAHKLAPALAAGNAVVLKPASTTPLTSIALCRVLEQAGLPAGALNLVVGAGATLGRWLVEDERVAMVTFTGSPDVGRQIAQTAGIKKVTLELGNNSAVIVAPDADLDVVAQRCAIGAYAYSGQVCISVQNVLHDRRLHDPFAEKLVAATEAMVVGDPLDERVDVGPMIDEREAQRIEGWVGEAAQQGAAVLTGGRREGAIYYPTLLDRAAPAMRVVAQEAFGPVANLIACEDFAHALHLAEQSRYGLQVGVFTRDIARVFEAIRGLNYGGVIINDIPTFRVDQMPYGGNRLSGLGREGVRFAVEEMTNIQMVAIRLGPAAAPAETAGSGS